MLKKIKRGPDDEKFYHQRTFVEVIRLSINDIENGNQPFYSDDKNIIIFYNEIYNYKIKIS